MNASATDFVLDIVCYRRHGHNETDEPAFTQPLMYARSNRTRTTRTLYAEKLAAEGVVPAAEAQAMWDGFNATLEESYKAAQGVQAEQGRLAGRPLVRLQASGPGATNGPRKRRPSLPRTR